MERNRLALPGSFGISLLLLSLIGLLFLCNCHKARSGAESIDESPSRIGKQMTDIDKERFIVDEEAKQRIDNWIKENNLNLYGDPKDTIYTGGTPLFDEKTGKTIDRYQYILKKHPELRVLERQ